MAEWTYVEGVLKFRCEHMDEWAEVSLAPGFGFRIVQEEPLTVLPELRTPDGCKGFIRDGKWEAR